MDTLTLGVNDERQVYLIYSIFERPQTQDELLGKFLDFHNGALEDRDSIIPFNITINELGENWLEGFITDSI